MHIKNTTASNWKLKLVNIARLMKISIRETQALFTEFRNLRSFRYIRGLIWNSKKEERQEILLPGEGVAIIAQKLILQVYPLDHY